jgi:hypothetical protein
MHFMHRAVSRSREFRRSRKRRLKVFPPRSDPLIEDRNASKADCHSVRRLLYGYVFLDKDGTAADQAIRSLPMECSSFAVGWSPVFVERKTVPKALFPAQRLSP